MNRRPESKASVLVALHRIGPYHHARLHAASQGLVLEALETRPQSSEYPWAFSAAAEMARFGISAYSIHWLQGATDPERDQPLTELDRQLSALLDERRPDVVVSVGWADRAYQRLLLACHHRHIPLVIVSDSREHDGPRSAAKEWIKRSLLRAYSAALVAGSESRAYLKGLDFPSEAIFQPWDVVDNDLLQTMAATVQPERGARPHFLCVGRFVVKKNHSGLVAAYGRYQAQAGSWGLRLIGTGPLEAVIRTAIAALPDPSKVRLDPFLQLEDLAIAYGQASAFVLASSTDQWGLVVNEAMAAGLPCIVSRACGCAADLIEHGFTGWSFAPNDLAALTALLHSAEQQGPIERQGMAAAARERLNHYTPAEFAAGLRQAVKWARAQPRHSRRSAIIADLLSRRS